jgi:hypothetical protein
LAKESCFAVILSMWAPLSLHPNPVLRRSIQIARKPQCLDAGVWLEEWKAGPHWRRARQGQDHQILKLPNEIGSSVPLTIRAEVFEEEILNQNIIVLQIGFMSDSNSDSQPDFTEA